MTALPSKILLNGNKVPATTHAEMRQALGDLRDFIAAFLGEDSANAATLRSVLALPDAAATGGGWVRGLFGKANAASPATKYDFTCLARVYRNPTTGAVWASRSTTVISADAAVAGPAAGGRDQPAAFSSGFINLFFIVDDAGNERAVWSKNAPGLGPNTISGFSSWVYGHTVYWDGSSIRRCVMNGCANSFASPADMGSIGNTGGSEVFFNGASLWPAWANKVSSRVFSFLVSNGGGSGVAYIDYHFISGFSGRRIDMNTPAAFQGVYYNENFDFPNLNQQVICTVVITAGTANISAIETKISVTGFTVPNGDVA